MADEISVSLALQVYRQTTMSMPVGRGNAAPGLFDWSNNSWIDGVTTVLESLTKIPMGSVAQPHWSYVCNRSSSNYVELRFGFHSQPFARLYAGEVACLPLPNNVTFPGVAATVDPTGGGASGGSLGSGTYQAFYTVVDVDGNESAVGFSQSASFTVNVANIPRVTFPALGLGVASYNLYCTSTSLTNPRQYATGITTTTYDMTDPLPALSTGHPAPPALGDTGLWAQAVGGSVSLEYLVVSR